MKVDFILKWWIHFMYAQWIVCPVTTPAPDYLQHCKVLKPIHKSIFQNERSTWLFM